MRVEYRTIPVSEIGNLNEYGSEGWVADFPITTDNGQVIIMHREVKKTKAEKKAEMTTEYLEFKKAYPRKVGITSDSFISKYSKIVSGGLHNTVMTNLKNHIAYWESSNLAAGRPKDDTQFVPHASTWINDKRWEVKVKPAFIPEAKKVKSELETLVEKYPEHSRKKIIAVAEQYLADHPKASLTESLISQIAEKYG